VNEDTRDRRQFYRINDRASLNYQVMPSADIEREIAGTRRRRQELSELRNAAGAIDARLEVMKRQLQQDHPLIAETLELFHRKIALHERMLGVDEQDENVLSQAREINLSASGAAFDAETRLYSGTFLKIELVLYPEHHYIPLFARVVQCQQIQDDSPAGFRIAVEFTGISEEDEERIVNHIFMLQAQQIKKEKTGPGEDAAWNEEKASSG